MRVERIHHVAYRCGDAKATADFYGRVLGMGLVGAVAEDQVPSTGEADTYMNIFLDAGEGNLLAFFEVPHRPPMQRDPNTPAWVQHIAFEVADVEALLETKARAEAAGQAVIGPIDHTIFRSIYFFDPDGHRLEVAAWTAAPGQRRALAESAPEILEDWSRTKRPSSRTAWVHARLFGGR